MILFFTPVNKQLIWGSESWTISAHPNGDARVSEGRYAGMTLSRLWREQPELFGNTGGEIFPLLIKIIEARDDLSIQVHPDDDYAGKNENGSLGKTECWYILDCDEDARLVLGHNAADREQLREMITSGSWSELIREVKVHKGDFIQIDPGTVHAVKGGIKLLETQQSSDITYRIYDYDRRSGGEPRPLHLRQGLEVITAPSPAQEGFIVPAAERTPNQRHELISCDYYIVWQLTVADKMTLRQESPFLIACVIAGDGLIDGRRIKAGEHFILPRDYGEAGLYGNMQLILAAPPWPPASSISI